MKQQLLITTPAIEERKGELYASSLNIADVFGKRHDNVLQIIQQRIADLKEIGDFNALDFQGVTYVAGNGEKRPMYLLSEKAFMFVSMKLTGKKAIGFQWQFVCAFKAMRQALTQRQNTQWIEERKNGKLIRRETTDAIKDFIEYAKANGSKSADMYYMLVTKAVYKCLEMIEGNGPVPKNMRDMLDARNLRVLATAEDVARCAFIEGMNQGMFYRDIFQFAKNHVEAYAKSVMPTLKGSHLRLIKSA